MATLANQADHSSTILAGDDPLPLWQWGALFCGALAGVLAQRLLEALYSNLTYHLWGWPRFMATIYLDSGWFSGWFNNAGIVLGAIAALVWGRRRRRKAKEAASLAIWFGLAVTLLSVWGIGILLSYAVGGAGAICGTMAMAIMALPPPPSPRSWAAQVIGGSIFTNVPLHGALLMLCWGFCLLRANRHKPDL